MEKNLGEDASSPKTSNKIRFKDADNKNSQNKANMDPEITKLVAEIIENKFPQYLETNDYQNENTRLHDTNFGRSRRMSNFGNSSINDTVSAIRKWNIKFSGSNNESAEQFLEDVEDFRKLTQIDDDESLLEALPVMLKDKAKQWYRNMRTSWSTWMEFRTDFRLRYGDPSFQKKLRDQAYTRLQGPDEPVAEYVQNMRTIFNHFDKPMELSEQLDKIYDNLKPELKLLIRRSEVGTIRELEPLAREREQLLTEKRDFKKCENKNIAIPEACYRPGRRNNTDKIAEINEIDDNIQIKNSKTNVQSIEERVATIMENFLTKFTEKNRNVNPNNEFNNENFKFKSDSRKFGNDFTSKNTLHDKSKLRETNLQPTNEVNPNESSEPRPPFKCFNCDKIGHSWRNCRYKKNLFCYRCGYKQVKTFNCPNCQENEKRTNL